MSEKNGCMRKFTVSMLGTAVDSVLLVLVLLYQGSMLNHDVIEKNAGSMGWYFWFLADFFVLGTFVVAVVFAFRHNHNLGEKLSDASFPESVGSSLQRINQSVVDGAAQMIPRFGVLPFSYIAWMLYSSLLAAKIVIIFKSGEAVAIDASSPFAATSLKVTIAMSGVIFLLLVYSHENWNYVFCFHKSKAFTKAEENFEVNRQGFINFLVGTTVFELLDCVTFLSILLVEESKIILTYPLENFVLAFSCINFLLPTITLYKISMSNFGRAECPVGALLLYKILHLLLVNVPYLAVRIYLWTAFDRDVSLFIVKNILGIFSVLRTIIPDSWHWVNRHKFGCSLPKAGRRRKQSVELGVIYDGKTARLAEETGGAMSVTIRAGPSFHEINLNDETSQVNTRLMSESDGDSASFDSDEHTV